MTKKKITGCLFENTYHKLDEPFFDDMEESDNPYYEKEEV